MTNHEEEQNMEIEALEAIFMDDFSELDSSPRRFQITVAGEEGSNAVVSLIFTYTEKYPDEPPLVYVKYVKGMTEDQCSTLQSALIKEADSLVGMAMAHTLVQSARDWLAANVLSAAEIEARKERAEEELRLSRFEQREEFKGTPVTLENFKEWKLQFDAEVELERQKKLTDDTEKKKKLTGRQLFEGDKTLITSDAILMDEEDLYDEDLYV